MGTCWELIEYDMTWWIWYGFPIKDWDWINKNDGIAEYYWDMDNHPDNMMPMLRPRVTTSWQNDCWYVQVGKIVWFIYPDLIGHFHGTNCWTKHPTGGYRKFLRLIYSVDCPYQNRAKVFQVNHPFETLPDVCRCIDSCIGRSANSHTIRVLYI